MEKEPLQGRFRAKLETNMLFLTCNCHDSFFTNDYNAGDVNYAFVQLQDFIRQLREYPLTDEKRIELEKDNFNEDF
uniref:HNH endonuclease n=1 Tax=Caenorhabditis tropicalis TaxID=1561998 RepID=A0A1I7SXC6_9PELO